MVYNAIMAQSGGPTAVINSSLAGVIDTLIKSDKIKTVYGAVNGIEGLLNENIIKLNKTFSSKENIDLLKHTPAAYLGSCRYKMPKDINDIAYKKVFDIFEKNDIKYFFYIGGNDSMDTVHKLNTYAIENGKDVVVMGIPKTVDNDLYGTDHCPGFGSAAKYVATTVAEIARDAFVYDAPSVTIVEIMGRNAGWLTASSALARSETCDAPHLIYCPENAFDLNDFIGDVKKVLKKVNNVIVAISEGIKDKDGNYILPASSASKNDKFGHTQLGGAAKTLELYVKEKIGCKVRSIELNMPQRCAGHFTSKTDVEESFKVGRYAVKQALKGVSGNMAIYVRKKGNEYKIEYSCMDISLIANKEKMLPENYITRNDVTKEFIKYARPLIEGECKIKMKNGIPVHIARNK